MLHFDTAQAILSAIVRSLGTESVPLAKAGRRVLAAPVCAAMDIPARDLAAMDGFAVREADLIAGRRHFAVVGEAYPGLPWTQDADSGQAVRIMTGAPMPNGFDRVLMRELVRQQGKAITFEGEIPVKPHVRKRGADTVAGDAVLSAGRQLDPRALVAAAAADAGRVTVWRRPRLHVIATGDELVAPGHARDAEAVPDSLSEAMLLTARQWGAEPMGATILRDDVALLRAAAADKLRDADVLVLCGGASRGDRDFAKAALVPLGLGLAFADVAIKPGKPVWLGRIGAKLILGLPGNPTAAMTVARLFLAPLLSALSGSGVDTALRWKRDLLTDPVMGGDREAFLCAEQLAGSVRVLPRQSASAQCMLAHADVLVRVPACARLAAGSSVDVLRF